MLSQLFLLFVLFLAVCLMAKYVSSAVAQGHGYFRGKPETLRDFYADVKYGKLAGSTIVEDTGIRWEVETARRSVLEGKEYYHLDTKKMDGTTGRSFLVHPCYIIHQLGSHYLVVCDGESGSYFSIYLRK